MEEGDSLDLSYLTDTEQAAILEVLLRDSDLRRCDEGRVRTLQQTERDPTLLRTLSGLWFNEERSKRHRDQKLGCDLVHATLRRRKAKGKDGPLSGLFAGQPEGGTPAAAHPSPSPAVTPRLQAAEEEEERGGSQECITPKPTPRSKSPLIQRIPDPNSTSSSPECMNTSNGHHEEAKDDFECQDGDTDSVSSGVTELYPTSLKNGSSVNSLHGSYALSGSMMSLFSTGEFGAVEVKGRVQFSLVFDKHMDELQVKVCRCEDLAAAHKNRSDPYVKTYLLPDKSSQSKKKTSVKKKTLNPVYDQTLRYKVHMGDLRGRTLNLSVWHAQPLGKNVFLGEVELPLGLWDWASTQPAWHDLQPRIQLSPDSISSRGTISLSIKFLPEGSEGSGLPLTGELHIWLREAQGLLSNKGGAVDSFVKSYILPDASRQSGQKTKVVKRTFSPTYNHTMVYDGFQNEDLREACADLTVWQREGLKTHPLGGVRLSFGTGQSYGKAVNWMDSTEEEIAVWATMMETPNQWIDATLPIRTNLMPRVV